MQEKDLQAIARNIVLRDAYLKLHDALIRAQVQAMPLKGMAFLLLGLPRSEARYMGDIDLLVRPKDAAAAADVLASLGYSCSEKVSRRAPACGSYRNTYAFTSIGPVSFSVHLHWDLRNCTWPLFSVRFNAQSIWEQAQTLAVEGRKVPMMSPHQLIVYLSLHGLWHGFDRLILLEDMAGVIGYYGSCLDWDKAVAEARQSATGYAFTAALGLVEELYGVELPRSARTYIEDKDPYWFISLMKRMLQRKRPGSPLLAYAYILVSQARIADKIRFFLRTIFREQISLKTDSPTG